MLSPLKPLLCRHDFYWSERHRADRCRRCGKTCEPVSATGPLKPLPAAEPPAWEDPGAVAGRPARPRPGAKALKAQALERRANLLTLLERIAEGGQPSRQESLDALLGVIEDAHSADPVLFGSGAAGHFARLHDARQGLIL